MDKKRELWNRFLDTQKDYLTAKNGHTRRVLGIYLSGSFGRKMSRSESDLDLIVLLKEDKYDWLTSANLQGQVKLRDQDLLADIAQELHLPYTPLVCDVKFTGLAIGSFITNGLVRMALLISSLVQPLMRWPERVNRVCIGGSFSKFTSK